jgi:hypothetical protein
MYSPSGPTLPVLGWTLSFYVLLWVITWRVDVVGWRRFGTFARLHLHRSSETNCIVFWLIFRMYFWSPACVQHAHRKLTDFVILLQFNEVLIMSLFLSSCYFLSRRSKYRRHRYFVPKRLPTGSRTCRLFRGVGWQSVGLLDPWRWDRCCSETTELRHAAFQEPEISQLRTSPPPPLGWVKRHERIFNLLSVYL